MMPTSIYVLSIDLFRAGGTPEIVRIMQSIICSVSLKLRFLLAAVKSDWKPLTILAKSSILDVWQYSELASDSQRK